MIRTVRHPNLSLWQSCVAETLRKQSTETERSMLVRSVVEHPVMAAVNRHVVGEQKGTKTAAPQRQALKAFEDLDEAAYVSSLKFQMAETGLSGDTAALQQLEAECRKYATCDWDGWITCLSTYNHYKKKYKEPLYRDWKKLGKDVRTYGVIDYKLPANAKVALIGDWGTGMDDAVDMLQQISEFRPDAVIHLGDIYYSGTPDECQLNVAIPFSKIFPEGQRPLFLSIPGNHDYYAFGEGFYQLVDEANPEPDRRQEASYFCLRTEDGAWQFLGMDTGRQDYDPYPWGQVSAPDLEASEKAWHHDKLAANNFKGNTILLSHHQLFSQHGKVGNGQRPWANEHLLSIFEPYFDRIAAWFWGHEHNLALYQNGCMGLSMGRLVGCSAYEESTGESPYEPYSNEFAAAVPYRQPVVELSNANGYYHHGYAIIDLATKPPTVNYYQLPSWGKDRPVNPPKVDKIASEQINQPPQPEPKGPVVDFDKNFYLQHSGGEYVVGFYEGQQYYPRLGNTGSVGLKLTGGTGKLQNGAKVQIVSSEDNLKGYNVLGAWSLKHDVYYYTKDYDQKKQSWNVIKKSDPEDPNVHYGDEVYLSNVSFAQRLVKDEKYMTTVKGNGETWFLRDGPVTAQVASSETTDQAEPVEGEASPQMTSPPRTG